MARCMFIFLLLKLIFTDVSAKVVTQAKGGRMSDSDYGCNPDQHTTVHHAHIPSFLDRVGSSIWAALFGLLIIIGAFLLLYWNEAMFEPERAFNVTLTWAIRAVGWLMFVLGFIMMTSILTALVSWIPIMRDIVGLGVTLVCFAMASSFSLVVIAISWIRFRPKLGCALLATVFINFFVYLFKNFCRG